MILKLLANDARCTMYIEILHKLCTDFYIGSEGVVLQWPERAMLPGSWPSVQASVRETEDTSFPRERQRELWYGTSQGYRVVALIIRGERERERYWTQTQVKAIKTESASVRPVLSDDLVRKSVRKNSCEIPYIFHTWPDTRSEF